MLNERLLVVRQIFKVDLKDHLIIHADDCGPTERAKNVSTAKKRQGAIDTNKPRETAWSRSQALSGLKVDTGLDGRDRGRASQFDPAIDKERKLISNLR